MPPSRKLTFLDQLTPAQLAAATHTATESLQILAGPGSGKTRTLTSRVAWLVQDQNLSPETCVVVTFTNKAAQEMRHRLNTLIGATVTDRLVMGTFHAVCVRLLRKHGRHIQLSSDFVIVDREESKSRIKSIVKEFALGVKPDDALNVISSAKSKNISVAQYRTDPKNSKEMIQIYGEYQKGLEDDISLDFDDILMYAARMLHKTPHIVSSYRHVLVDEFQDTSVLQLEIMTLLAASCRCVTVVGDADQSIYGWRSAEVENLARMRAEFTDTKQVFLEENFRSTSTIVEAALRVVQQDSARIAKGLRTSHPAGPPIVLRAAPDAEQEATFIATEIARLIAHSGGLLSYNDFAILLRYNALSRPIEAHLQALGIPNRILGGNRFFDRREVRDVMAYVTLVAHPRNSGAFERVVNVPKRGIGEISLRDFVELAKERRTGPMILAEQLLDMRYANNITCRSEKVAQSLRDFAKVIKQARREFEKGMNLSDLIALILEQVQYFNYLKKEPGWEARWENIKELQNFANSIDRASAGQGAQESGTETALGSLPPDSLDKQEDDPMSESRAQQSPKRLLRKRAMPSPNATNESASKRSKLPVYIDVDVDTESAVAPLARGTTPADAVDVDALNLSTDTQMLDDVTEDEPSPIQRFLEASTLNTDEKAVESDGPTDYVTISTCHSAKGLEWPTVFVAGVEDGKFPFYRSETPAAVDEERRLLYVAITRAQTNLYLTRSETSFRNGQTDTCSLSRFLTALAPLDLGGTATSSKDTTPAIPRMAFVPSRPTLSRQVLGDMSVVLERLAPSSESIKTAADTFASSSAHQQMQINDLECARGSHQKFRSQKWGSRNWQRDRGHSSGSGAFNRSASMTTSSYASRRQVTNSSFTTARALSTPSAAPLPQTGFQTAKQRLASQDLTNAASTSQVVAAGPKVVKAAPSFTNSVRLYGTAEGSSSTTPATSQTATGPDSAKLNLANFQSKSKSTVSSLLDLLPP